MTRLTLAGPSLLNLESTPAQDIKLLIDDEVHGRVTRHYTIRHARPDLGEVDIDVLVHGIGGGPGSRWADRVRPGARVDFAGPKGHLDLRPADWHLFVGDEAALPAIATLTESLGAGATAIVLAEIASEDDRIPIRAHDVRWLNRAGSPPGTTTHLAAALESLRPPPGDGHAYLLGESRTVHALRGHLNAHRIAADRAFVKGYWHARP